MRKPETLHLQLIFPLVLVTGSYQWQRDLCSTFLQKELYIQIKKLKLSNLQNVNSPSKFCIQLQEHLESFLGEFWSHLQVHCNPASAVNGTHKLIRMNKIFASIEVQRRETMDIDIKHTETMQMFTWMNGSLCHKSKARDKHGLTRASQAMQTHCKHT